MNAPIEAEYIWRNGECIPWREANIHVLSTAVQFGSSVFEGIRCYEGVRQPWSAAAPLTHSAGSNPSNDTRRHS